MAQLSQLLLYDPDPRGLDTLTFGFEKVGCSVTGTADPAKARDLAQGANPSLVLVSLRSNEQAGLELLHAVTANPRTRNVPVVALGAEELREAALGAGAFVFLSMPMFLRDVIGVCRMVVAAAVPGSRPSPDTELSMQLQDLDGVYFLVRALTVTGRSAVVEVRHGTVRGELRFIDGALTSADLGSVQGLPALHQMLLWEDAALHFKFKNVVRRGAQISLKSSEVLEECDRFLRDFAHEAKDLGVARTIYVADLAHVQPSDALPGEVVPVLKLFDGRKDLAQVLDESPFRVFDTLKIIKRFAADGAIQSSTPAPRVQAAAPSGGGAGALETWLQKPAPAPGTEFVVGLPQNGVATLPAAAGARPGSGNGAGSRHPFPPSSPFVALGTIVVGDSAAMAREAPDQGGIPNLRVRTVTKKNVADGPAMFPDDMVTPPPVVNGASRGDSLARNDWKPDAQPQSHPQSHMHPQLQPQLQARLQPNHLNRPQPQVHPRRQFQMHPSPPLQAHRQPMQRDPQLRMGPPPEPQQVPVDVPPPLHAAAERAEETQSPPAPEFQAQPETPPEAEKPPAAQAQVTLPSNAPAKPSSAVARGEIKISLTAPREHESGPIPQTPSVLVELADPLPSVVTSPTPDEHHAPVSVGSNATRPRLNAESANGESAPPSVIVAAMTPAPEMLAPTPIASAVAPEPSATLARAEDLSPVASPPAGPAAVPSLADAPAALAAAPEAKRHGRSPSDSFNAVEADFFDREADLYKRESVESFEDLDHHQNGTRKR